MGSFRPGAGNQHLHWYFNFTGCVVELSLIHIYDCSYQQVRNWVIRYEKMGQAGLEDRRGRRIASLPSRTPEDVYKRQILYISCQREQRETVQIHK